MTAAIIPQAVEQARAAVYLLFANLFREPPSVDLLRTLAGVEDPRWAIAVEYARVFVVPGERTVRPYESVYCDALTIDETTACSPYFSPQPPRPGGLAGFLHGPSAVAVREAYQQAGFEMDAACHELPDHLAIELEFMGRLLERRACEPARRFFEEHLGRWAFRCLADVKQQAHSAFYRTIADSLTVFLRRAGAGRSSPEAAGGLLECL